MCSVERSDVDDESLLEALVEVGRFANATDAHEHGLVVLALGWPYWLTPTASGTYRLLVESDAAPAVQRHVAAYGRERGGWPPPSIADPWVGRPFAWLTPSLWSALVLACYLRQAPWVAAGMLDAQAIFSRGEWWRIATALFLHGSAAHVISNALSGILIFTATVATLGLARGWLLITVAALSANFAMAAAHFPGEYRSVGASTALFAAVGLLTGRAIRVVARSLHPYRWRAMFVPLAAGATVLALHGASGENVDLGAHLAGFATGLLLGFAFGVPALRRTR